MLLEQVAQHPQRGAVARLLHSGAIAGAALLALEFFEVCVAQPRRHGALAALRRRGARGGQERRLRERCPERGGSQRGAGRRPGREQELRVGRRGSSAGRRQRRLVRLHRLLVRHLKRDRLLVRVRWPRGRRSLLWRNCLLARGSAVAGSESLLLDAQIDENRRAGRHPSRVAGGRDRRELLNRGAHTIHSVGGTRDRRDDRNAERLPARRRGQLPGEQRRDSLVYTLMQTRWQRSPLLEQT